MWRFTWEDLHGELCVYEAEYGEFGKWRQGFMTNSV